MTQHNTLHYAHATDKNINNPFSFNTISRYFVTEGFISLVFTGEQSQLGIAQKEFLNIKKESIVMINRDKNHIIIKSYYYPKLNMFQIQDILTKNEDNFDNYPEGYEYNKKIYKFKLNLEEIKIN